MEIQIGLTPFYSMGDERRFFQGLEEVAALKNVVGSGRDLFLNFDMRLLGQETLRDLIALLWRYQISIEPFALLAERKKFAWLRDEQAYWYKNMGEKKK